MKELERCVALRTEELSRINEELRASEAWYRNVVDTQTEFIVRWLPNGTRTFVNEAYCRFRKQAAEALVGTSFLPMLYHEDRDRFEAMKNSISPAQPSATYETRAHGADGELHWLQWTTRAIFDGAGRATEYQSVGRDVTELKHAADLLRQKEVHLAHLARLATMGEMVAGIAHEIGQPLHAAATFAEAARRHLESGRPGGAATAIDCMHEISAAVARTVAIIRRLREFSKTHAVRRNALNLNDVVREAVELMSYDLRRVGATLDLDLGEPTLKVDGDRIQLVQVCVNLLKNACESMEQTPPDQRRLEVRVSADDGRVCLAVRDSGSGLKHSEPARLFEAFYSTKQDGMGMGLSLCKSIADAHGAQLWFTTNAPEPGMAFHFAIDAGKEPPC